MLMYGEFPATHFHNEKGQDQMSLYNLQLALPHNPWWMQVLLVAQSSKKDALYILVYSSLEFTRLKKRGEGGSHTSEAYLHFT